MAIQVVKNVACGITSCKVFVVDILLMLALKFYMYFFKVVFKTRLKTPQMRFLGLKRDWLLARCNKGFAKQFLTDKKKC